MITEGSKCRQLYRIKVRETHRSIQAARSVHFAVQLSFGKEIR